MNSNLDKALALEGGRPCVPEHLVAHDWYRLRKATKEEIDAVVKVMESGHLSIVMGKGMPNSEALEREFSQYIGAKYCLAVNSGTAALHCAVAGLGIQPGDEVIVPAFTFVASALVVLHQNAIPVFVDIDPRTYLIDPRKIEEKITKKTKAIMAVHIYGLPCDMDDINRIAQKHNLRVIEDCAQAYGAFYKGRKTGSLGDAAGFAMTTTKQLMTGEGGLFVTDSKEVYERASRTRLFGELADMRATDRAYMSESIGWNYKMPEMISALGRVRLRHLDQFISATEENARYLTERLKEIRGLETPYIPPDRTHTFYLYPVRVDPEKLNLKIEAEKLRNAVLKALAAENVRVGLWQKVPVPAQPIFRNKEAYGRGCPWSCHGAEDVTYRGSDYPATIGALEEHFVVMGLVPPNGPELMDHYAEAFRKVFENIERVVQICEEKAEYASLGKRLN